MFTATNKKSRRQSRHTRIRKKIEGTARSPRLAVFRSAKHIYVQAINDMTHVTIAGYSTLTKEIKEAMPSGGNVNAAKALGLIVAKKMIEVGISSVAFDRGGYRYHGRVKALADGLREGGLKF